MRYTPFDLPERITQGASIITFAYDGDQQRIRKTTPDKETLYFGDLYERVTEAASGTVEHRYHVHSPERVVAIVTRGSSGDGTRYVHVDHLGSVDALTDEDGDVIERRSYDPFGQRRNPAWGERPPASFPSETTQGFTGHESDDELGLVNMKGRIYDPKTGRFLTTDPIVSIPSFGQSWNPYSYVLNNPLAYVDPGGFQQALPEDGARSPLPAGAEFRWEVLDLAPIGLKLSVVPSPEHEARADADLSIVAAETGGAMPPIDVSTTGSASGYVPQPVSTAPEHTGTSAVVGQSLLGAAEGTAELAAGLARSLALNALTLGIYSGYELGSATWAGYEEGGLLGALNAVNPLYQIGRGAADTALAIDGGDYRLAGAAGTKTVLLAAAAVFGTGRGLGAIAEESAAVGGVRGAAAIERANAAQAAGRTSGVAAELRVGNKTFTDVSTGGASRTIDPRVAQALDRVPAAERSPFHGACAEIGCITQTLAAGIDPRGGVSTAVRIRRPGHPAHASRIDACRSCAAVLGQFGVDF
ncbi:RHS repeat-associated core domain-containing protein [Sorangium sp. So ce834]|uniref:RHS repeat domain-containing protein n=1 Tax=Sorangium sp. So ce834 TaxID=3133321 RepID=UPI003F6138B6